MLLYERLRIVYKFYTETKQKKELKPLGPIKEIIMQSNT